MTNFLKKIPGWWREMLRKRRLSVLNATDHIEEWHMHISPTSVFAALVAFLLVLFIIILMLVAYTPVLEFLPGYRTEAERSRESLVQNIIRLDSLERTMNDMMTYNQNISLIMEGKTPVMRTYSNAQDSTRAMKVFVVPSAEDSILRAQMEQPGAYAINGREAASRRQIRQAMELAVPIEGIITERIDIREGRLGIRIAAPAGSRVNAIDNGTVVQSLWTPQTGHTVIIQHPGNLLSVYKNLSQSLAQTGQTVRSGEQIGYNAEAAGGEAKSFGFELWSNGKPVDPESYIVF